MAAPETRIDWDGVPHSPSLEAQIRQQAARLAGTYSGASVLRVRLESPAQGGPVCASIEVRARERQILVNRQNEDPAQAVRQGFELIVRAFDRRRQPDRRLARAA